MPSRGSGVTTGQSELPPAMMPFENMRPGDWKRSTCSGQNSGSSPIWDTRVGCRHTPTPSSFMMGHWSS